MMIGMGTPTNQSRIERIVLSLIINACRAYIKFSAVVLTTYLIMMALYKRPHKRPFS